MKDSTKQNFDEIAADLSRARKTNGPTYWLMLIAAGTIVTGLLTLLLKTTGIIVLVTAAFVFMFNHLLNSWLEMRKAERKSEEAESKPTKKMPPPVVVEADKSKTVKINLK